MRTYLSAFHAVALILCSWVDLDSTINVPTGFVPVTAFVIPSPGNSFSASARALSHSRNSFSPATRLWLTATSTTTFDHTCDILVLGSGPAGRAISSLLERKNLDVCLADANSDRPFVPNYGVWQDEWDAVAARYANQGVSLTGGAYGKALNREWNQTDCFFGGSFGKPMAERTVIDRPYCQVDKNALKQSLTTPGVKIIKANHFSQAISINIFSPSGSLVHDQDGTTIVLKDVDGNDILVRSKLVVDTTGHESKLVLRDARAPANAPPGFQIAYGCLVKVNEVAPEGAVAFGPYDKEAMTLFDYRTDHLQFDSQWEQRAIRDPTFMYVMPLEDNRVFFEETSLVARPGVSFQECKDRCFKRLEFLGIDVADIEEEEYCYIPMGGSLPLKDQRIIALGGSNAMVHPSTGYHLCRMLMGAASVADAISLELSQGDPEKFNLDRAAASAYHSIWNPETIRQRNFAVFGGEFLMKQNVVGLRGFFDGFFKLPLQLWAGFLAGWPGLPNNDKHESWQARIWFGINFVLKLPPQVALDMLGSIVSYCLTEGAPLPQSVTPFLGSPSSYEYRDFLMENVGDVNAKSEARRLIQESKVTKVLPTAFESRMEESTSPLERPVTTPIEGMSQDQSLMMVEQEENEPLVVKEEESVAKSVVNDEIESRAEQVDNWTSVVEQENSIAEALQLEESVEWKDQFEKESVVEAIEVDGSTMTTTQESVAPVEAISGTSVIVDNVPSGTNEESIIPSSSSSQGFPENTFE